MQPEVTLPAGRVTIVFTDIENSSLMTSDLTDRPYLELLRNPHQAVLLAAFERHRGVPIQTQGDSFMAVFQYADDALACVAAIQNQLAQEPITASSETRQWTVRVRIGIHTTEREIVPDRLTWIPDAALVAGDVEYSGTDTNFASRVGGLGVGGQVIVSQSTYQAAQTRQQYAWQQWPNRRLKSFEAAPESVWELLYDGQSRGEPGARWVPDWYRGELNRYIARPDLQGRVIDHFKTGRDNVRRRLVTLYAEGGMGKTRLAVACAIEMVGLFQHGVYFVDLARDDSGPSARTRDAVAEAVSLSLGLSKQEFKPDVLLASLKTSERLLVLDNYESVDSKDVRLYLRDLIAQTNSLCLLVTSRTPVNLPDVEQIVPMSDGMSRDQALSLFLAYAALTERGPDWTPDAEDREDLERVLTLAERIPLAVELAAAWAGSRSIKEIADGLQKTPLGRMTRTPGDTDRADPSPHHYSLTRSLDWSYSLLDTETQHAFAPLCLFADGFGVDAAAAVLAWDQEDAEDVLDTLYRVSLLRRAESRKASRYSLHRFTQEYASGKLAVLSDADAIRRRFVAYYRRLIGLNPNLENATHRALLTDEWRNALAAVATAQTLEDWAAILSLFSLRNFLRLRGRWSEQEGLCRAALAAAEALDDRAGQGEALYGLGDIFRIRGQWPQAEPVLEQSLAIRRELDDRSGEGLTLIVLGILYRVLGKWEQAEQIQNESLVIFRELGDRKREAVILNNLGVLFLDRGEWQKAEQVYEQSLAIERSLGNRTGQGPSLGNLGLVYQNRGEWDKAERAHDESLAIFRELGDRAGEGRALNNLGEVYLSKGDEAKAEQAYEQSLAIRRELSDRAGEALTLNNLGWVYLKHGQAASAEKACLDGLAIYRDLGSSQGQGRTLLGLSEVYQALRRWDEAKSACEESLAIRRGMGDRSGEGETLIALGQLMQAQGRSSDAIAYAAEAVAVLKQTEDAAALEKARELQTNLLGTATQAPPLS